VVQVQTFAPAHLLSESIALNSTADIFWDGISWEHRGSKTECALLTFLRDKLNLDYAQLRSQIPLVASVPFSSESKRSVVLTLGGNLFVKGASEVVLEMCQSEQIGDEVRTISAERMTELQSLIKTWANSSMRTMCVAYKPGAVRDDLESQLYNLTLLGIFGIEDPLRPEVSQSIVSCHL
jgi:Ca2+-transporting ATPase